MEFHFKELTPPAKLEPAAFRVPKSSIELLWTYLDSEP